MTTKLRDKELWPLDAPGMPPPGDYIMEAAAVLGDTESRVEEIGTGKNKTYRRTYGRRVHDVVRRCLYDYGNCTLPINTSANDTDAFTIVCGHRWGANPQGGSPGPEPCDVMVIGKMMGDSEIGRRRQYLGPSGQKMLEVCNRLGIEGMGKWYVTNVIKTTDPTSGKKANVDAYSRQFLHLLHQELRLVRPKFILCLGGDALKALLGKDASVKKYEGTVLEYSFPVHKSENEPEEIHKCLVMVAINPAMVLKEPKQELRFERTMHRFDMLTRGIRWDEGEKGLDHRVIDDEATLIRFLNEMRANNPQRIVAIDAEWQGQHPMNRGAYLRCVQLSWRHKAAAVIALTHPGGAPRFRRIVRDENGEPVTYVKNGKRRYLMTTKGGKKIAMKLLQIGLRDRRIAGFFTVSDLEWLQYHGLDLRKQVDAPKNWRQAKHEGGLNVELMAHAADESDDFELNAQIQKWTSVPRYDLKLNAWLQKHKADRQKLGLVSIDGYGDVPDAILYPYAALDADATRRLCLVHMKRLDADEFGNNCWEVFHADQRAVLPVLEINSGGMLVDRKRLDEMTALFLSKRNELRAKVKRAFKWEDVIDGQGNLLQPGVNLESPFEVREILFGEELNRKETADGSVVRLRPPGAISLRAMPITTTGKRPQPWEEVIAAGKEKDFDIKPSTNKTALGIMLQEGRKLRCWSVKKGRYVHKDRFDILRDLQDYRFLNQVLKTVLRPPKQDKATQEYQLDEDGNWVYDRGLGSSICRDNYVRTYIAMVLETGRWSSSRPNLQNLGKRRDKDYKRILGDAYKYSIRSIMRADEGCVLIEADYIGAELFGMAILAQDKNMIDHALRNQLPEDHPDFYDIHSNVAVLAFNLKCEPTKKGLQSIDKEVLRIIAKSVVFGIAYGRGAKAIAMAAREEGIEISVDDAQRVIDTIFEMYPKLKPFFAECRSRAVSQYTDDGRLVGEPAPRFLVNSFMRRRRFPWTKDRKQIGDYEREAMNFPIQSLIADVVTRAIRKFYDYREKHGMKFRIALQIHDALLFCVPYNEVDKFITEVLPKCMRSVAIRPRGLDGKKLPGVKKPYRLGFDVEMSENWGELLYPDWLKARGIPLKHAHWKFDKNLRGYVNDKKGGKFWKKGRWYEIPKTETTAA